MEIKFKIDIAKLHQEIKNGVYAEKAEEYAKAYTSLDEAKKNCSKGDSAWINAAVDLNQRTRDLILPYIVTNSSQDHNHLRDSIQWEDIWNDNLSKPTDREEAVHFILAELSAEKISESTQKIVACSIW